MMFYASKGLLANLRRLISGVFALALIAPVLTAAYGVALSGSAEAAALKTIKARDEQNHYFTEGSITLPADSPEAIWSYFKGKYVEINREMKSLFSADPEEIERASNYGPYRHDMIVQTRFANDRILSTSMDYSSYQGGAHGFEYVRTALFDPKSGREIKPQDLFTDFRDGSRTMVALAKMAKAELIKRKIVKGWMDPPGKEDMFISQLEPKVDALSAFILVPNQEDTTHAIGLTFYFDPYAVGPYSEGIHQIFLGVSQLHPYLTPFAASLFTGDEPIWVEE